MASSGITKLIQPRTLAVMFLLMSSWVGLFCRNVVNQLALLAFYDFPAEHWIHLQTTNPIESTFATIPFADGIRVLETAT